jgi:hypothetical protein
VIKSRRGVEKHERRAEDRAADDVPGVAAKAGCHHEDDEPSETERQAQSMRDGVGDLLANRVER